MATLTQIQELLTQHKIVDPKAVSDFLALAGSRKTNNNHPANIIFENKEYYYCRNSGHYFLLEDMVKDKNGKAKGYSSIGNSIYTQAQKYKKSIIQKIEDKKTEIIELDFKSKTFDKDNKALRVELTKLDKQLEDGKYNDGIWMVEQFLNNLKPERVELFNKIAKTKATISK